MERVVIFLADAVIGFFTAMFLLRFLMQCMRVSFANPIGHLVVALTNWAAQPLRRVIPGFFGLDFACLLMAYLLQLLFFGGMFALSARFASTDPMMLLPLAAWAALIGLARLSLQLLIGALILQAVLSWVSPYSPFAMPVNQFTRPFLNPIRRILPPISGFDLSPLVAIVLAQALLMLL